MITNWEIMGDLVIGMKDADNRIERSERKSIVSCMLFNDVDDNVIKAYEKKEKENK